MTSEMTSEMTDEVMEEMTDEVMEEMTGEMNEKMELTEKLESESKETENPFDPIVKMAISDIMDQWEKNDYMKKGLRAGLETKQDVILAVVTHSDQWVHSQIPSIHYSMLKLYDQHGLLVVLDTWVYNELCDKDDDTQKSRVYFERLSRGQFAVKVSFNPEEWDDKKKMMAERLEKKQEQRGQMRGRGRRENETPLEGRGRGGKRRHNGRGRGRGRGKQSRQMEQEYSVPTEQNQFTFQQYEC
jgi:hypothetical protein